MSSVHPRARRDEDLGVANELDEEDSSLVYKATTSATAAASASESTATPLATDTTLPLPHSLGLASLYICTSMSYFLMIRHTKRMNDNTGIGYDSAVLVLLIELTKLAVSVALKYNEDGELIPCTVFCGPNRKLLWRRSVPYVTTALIYAVYNNMTFYNLQLFDIGTYQVFMQTRILFTGALFTVLLRQALSVRKWTALVLLMIGVAAKYFSPAEIQLDHKVLYMLLQAALSSFAGVYNEYAFKKDAGMSIHLQNFFLYFYAIFFNLLIGILMNPSYYRQLSLRGISHPYCWVIILLGAIMGLSAAFILKFINVIVKAFASAVEVLLSAVFAAILLGEALTRQDVLAAMIVMVSVYVYYTKGVGDATLVRFGSR